MFRPRSANASLQHAELELAYLFAQVRLQREFFPLGNHSTTSPLHSVKAGDPTLVGADQVKNHKSRVERSLFVNMYKDIIQKLCNCLDRTIQKNKMN